MPPLHPSHRLPLRSINNLRDLGGYPAADGKTVRRGLLYRSGHLGKVSRGDAAKLAALQLHTVIDFRSAEEKQRHPDRLPAGHAIRVLELPILDEGNAAMMQDMRRRYEQNDFDGLDTVAVMAHTYRQFPLDFHDAYRQFVQAVLEANGQPVLWHCTAGKDRAGFAAALLLRLLGAEYAVIEQDYLLSGKYIHPDRQLMVMILLTKGPRPVRLMRPLWQVRAAWLRGAFAAIDEHWGSFDTFTRQALGLSAEDVARLQELLLAG
ncbi:MAG: tyrosine-protein phosphatase [Anaerolineae bacterium]|nr:tyrosine-protein phosphatase [Anaerolineae bacterium]